MNFEKGTCLCLSDVKLKYSLSTRGENVVPIRPKQHARHLDAAECPTDTFDRSTTYCSVDVWVEPQDGGILEFINYVSSIFASSALCMFHCLDVHGQHTLQIVPWDALHVP